MLITSKLLRFECLKRARDGYRTLHRKKEKELFLDYWMNFLGYKSRKHLIKLLRPKKPSQRQEHAKRGRPSQLMDEDIVLLKKLWFACDQPCGKRLVAMLPEWIVYWKGEHGLIDHDSKQRILSLSSASLDRKLASVKISHSQRARYGSLQGLKSSIPIIDTTRAITHCGELCADTVAHGGSSMRGSFAWTLTVTDTLTQWTENRAVWNKSQAAVCQAFEYIFEEIPFPIISINTDNGSEFINHHLQHYWKEKHHHARITRSRPYHKNDNARAEQKNLTRVRELIGYDRLDELECVSLLNNIYENANLLHNYFTANMRVIKKTREGSKIIKQYDKAQTPYTRLMHVMENQKEKQQLVEQKNRLNPLQLRRKIDASLQKLYRWIEMSKQDEEND